VCENGFVGVRTVGQDIRVCFYETLFFASVSSASVPLEQDKKKKREREK
jgi:hypothetical protein